MMTEYQYRLLLVEDEVITDPELKQVFELTGFAVDTAITGQQAANLIHQNTYDAVVLDNMMAPGNGDPDWALDKTHGGLYTGLKVLERIAELPKPPPVWVVTALPDTDVERDERKFSFVQEVLKKPVSFALLSLEIRGYLDERATGHA